MNQIKYIDIYDKTLQYLYQNIPEDLNIIEIKNYFNPARNKPQSINDVFQKLVHHLQNYQHLPNSIKFESRISDFRELLFDFEPKKVLKNYSNESLFETLYLKYQFNNKESKRNTWRKFTSGIMSAATFISEFEDLKSFESFVKSFKHNAMTQAALPMLIGQEIFGMGFALACDFLKELGYTDYAKPDVHLKEILYALGLSDGSDLKTYKAIVEMANSVGKTPYEIDKIFWLISSGKYYYHKIECKGLKKELIEFLISNSIKI